MTDDDNQMAAPHARISVSYILWAFPYGMPEESGPTAIQRMNNTAWKGARKKAAQQWQEEHGTSPHPEFARIGVHDPTHTFRRRLRAARFSEEDRKALLGHRKGASRLTTRQRNWTNWPPRRTGYWPQIPGCWS